MLVILVASCLVDPLVLLGLLHVFAHNQVDTKYSTLFGINLCVGVIAIGAALLTLPIDIEANPLPPGVQIGGSLLVLLTIALVAPLTNVTVPRAFLVTAFFWAYKVVMVLSFLRFLAVLGLQIDFQGVDLEDLNSGKNPAIFDWLLEHGLWLRTDSE